MVCFYHAGRFKVGFLVNDFYLPNLNKIILNLCTMSVPLFFMVNGALMLRRDYSWKEIVFRTLKICFLYFFWVIVIGELGVHFLQMDRVSLMGLLKGKRSGLAVHLWFLKTLGVLTFLLPVLKKIYDLKSKKILYGIMGCLMIFPFIYNYFVLTVRWFRIELFEGLSVTGAATMYSVLYFFLGKLISDFSAKQDRECRKYQILAAFSIILGLLFVTIEVTLWSNIKGSVYDVNSSFPTIGALLMAVGVFFLCSRVKVNDNSKFTIAMKALGDQIMGIYIFHNVCIPFIIEYVYQYGTFGMSLITTILIVLGTALITAVIKRVPILRELVAI